MAKSKIERFDLAGVRALRAEVQEALDALGKDLGVGITVANISYARDGRTCSAKLECAVMAEGTVVSPGAVYQVEFERSCARYGLQKEDLGKTFSYFGKTYKIVGLLPKCRTKTILCEDIANGKQYKFSPNDVLFGLGREPVLRFGGNAAFMPQG